MGAKAPWQQLTEESRLNMEVSEARIQPADRESPGQLRGQAEGRQEWQNGLEVHEAHCSPLHTLLFWYLGRPPRCFWYL